MDNTILVVVLIRYITVVIIEEEKNYEKTSLGIGVAFWLHIFFGSILQFSVDDHDHQPLGPLYLLGTSPVSRLLRDVTERKTACAASPQPPQHNRFSPLWHWRRHGAGVLTAHVLEAAQDSAGPTRWRPAA